jgi:hypothetical protein
MHALDTVTYPLPAALREIVWTSHIFQWQASAEWRACARCGSRGCIGQITPQPLGQRGHTGPNIDVPVNTSMDSPHIEALPPRSNARRSGCAPQSR